MRAGGNFDLYTKGYRARNRAIRAALKVSPDRVAVVTDIQSFYPSAKQPVVLHKFSKALEEAGDLPFKKEIQGFARKFIEASPAGIPIGGNLSHVMGNLLLADVDVELERRFPGSYFRYVDDIVVVCERAEARGALQLVRDLLGKEQLLLNDYKTDISEAQSWYQPTKQADISARGDLWSFEDLTFFVEMYLARNPDETQRLQDELRERQVALPVTRWAAAASQTRFRAYLFRELRRRSLTQIFKAFTIKKPELIDIAKGLQPVLSAELANLVADIPQSGVGRRLALQRARYLSNRLIFLSPVQGYRALADVLSRFPEFYETEVLLKAVMDADATPLLDFPGRTIAAFVELWKEVSSDRPAVKWEMFRPNVGMDALATLALGGLVIPPEWVVAKLNPYQQELLRFCSGASGNASERVKGSFVDEVRSLQNGRSHSFVLSMLESRFSLKESSGLQLFRLDSPYYPH